jgi:cell fate regulator YaaT (PSP1 superfamily)
MPQTVEVRFKGIRRDFFRWNDDQEPLRLTEAVLVECERGQDFGRVHTAGEAALKKCGGSCSGCERGTADKTPLVAGEDADAIAGEHPERIEPTLEAPAGEPAEETVPEARGTAAPAGLRPVLRRATPDEIRVANDLRRAEDEVRRQSMEKVRQHKLEMKVADAEWQWDRSKLTLFFTAEKRVDFRALVRDLASAFRTRIELRQIGVRDEAARLGGVGRCGREYCCSTWLSELTPVSLALAKDQHLSLNPAQISGGCGRLLCCLKYEHEFYVAARKRFPREGKIVVTARGAEKVIAVDIFRERVFVRNEEGSRIVPLVDLREEMERAQAGGPVVVPPGPAPRDPAPRPGASRPERGRRPERSERPARSERPVGRPESGRPAPGTPAAPASEPSRPAPPSTPPPHAPAPDRPTGETKRPRRRRRGRRGGRGGQGPQNGSPSPPDSPEA